MRWNLLPKAFILASFVVLGASAPARATFNYSTSIVLTGISSGGATTPNTAVFGTTIVTVGSAGQNGLPVPSTQLGANIGTVNVQYVGSPGVGDSFFVDYTNTITITNLPPPGAVGVNSFVLTGRLTFSGIGSATPTITNQFFAPTSSQKPVGGVDYIVSGDGFVVPVVNGTNGNLLADIIAVPEPGSFALLGIGGLAAIGMLRPRRRRVTA